MNSREERMFLCYFSPLHIGQNVNLFTEDQESPHAQKLSWVCSGSLPRFPTQTQNKGLVLVVMGTHLQLTVKSGIKWKKKKTALQVVRCVAESVYFLGLDVEEELLGEGSHKAPTSFIAQPSLV